MKKMTKKILSMILVSALVLTMGIGAFAEEGAAEANLVKTLDVADGITVPEGMEFTFTVAEGSDLELKDDNDNAVAISNGCEGYTDTITIAAADAAAENGATFDLYTLFEADEFPHAGVYAFTLTEDDSSYATEDNETLTCNPEGASYTVVVVVENADDGLAISKILIYDEGGDKVGSADFNNKYVKENTDDTALTISKTVDGAMGDKENEFTFTLTITAPEGFEDEVEDLTATIEGTGTADSVGYGENTIKLAHGATLKVSGILFGSTYQVEEAGEDDSIQNYASYDTEVEVNGETIDGKDTDEVLLSDTEDNTVAFTNTLEEIPITGVIINTLPYVLIVAIAAAGFFYMQMKKRV